MVASIGWTDSKCSKISNPSSNKLLHGHQGWNHRFRETKKFQRKIVNIFLPIIFSICFECSKKTSHWDSSFKYPQQMFWLRNKKNNYYYYYFSVTHSKLKSCRIHKILARLANREDPEQSDLSLRFLSRPFWQVTSVRKFRASDLP